MEFNIVLLEHPQPPSQRHFNDVANTPLSSCLFNGYIAATLKEHGNRAAIYDAYLNSESFGQCIKGLTASNVTLLGINAVYLWERTEELFLMLNNFKSINQEARVILYGFFSTFVSREILSQYSFIDCVIIGEPEETFLEIASSCKKRGYISYAEIPGLAYRNNGEIITTERRPLLDPLDELPFPERSELFLKRIGANIFGSRGCYGNCRFCYINNFYGSGCLWRGRTPDNIAREIAALVPCLNEPYIYFVDANFFGQGHEGRKRAIAIIERIKAWSKLEFGIECRSNDIDKKLVSLMAQAGLKNVFLGIESGSAGSLKRMNKGLTSTKNKAAVQLLKSYGIETNLGFIMYAPDSTLEDVRSNFEFLQSNHLLDSLSCTANVLYHREIILKGTGHYALLSEQKRLRFTDQLGYEGTYMFQDNSVEFLADLMETVCRNVLQGMEKRQSPIYWKKQPAAATRRVNDFLVYMFAEVLKKLELKELPLTPEERLKWEARAFNVLEGLIVSEQICHG